MKLQIAKWGNSLAVRLPVECLRTAGLKAGDILEAQVDPSGAITLRPEIEFNKKSVLSAFAQLHKDMPQTDPVIDILRNNARY